MQAALLGSFSILARFEFSLSILFKKSKINDLKFIGRADVVQVIIAIYISAEIKLRDEKNLRRDIYFMKEFETFLGLFLSRA